MTPIKQPEWDPYWNRNNADYTMMAVTPQDVVELVQASASCRVTKSATPTGRNARFVFVVEVEPDVALAWEQTRQ